MVHQTPEAEIAYVDKLSFRSLWSIARSRRAFSHIFFFDQTENAPVHAGRLRRLGLLRAEPEYVFFRLGDLKDERGGRRFFNIFADATSACAVIEKEELVPSRVLQAAARRFDREKLFLFFKKIIGSEIHLPFINVQAVDWHSREQGLYGAKKTLFLANSLWWRYISDYADEHNITAVKYGLVRRSVYFRAKLAGLTGPLKRRIIKKNGKTQPLAPTAASAKVPATKVAAGPPADMPKLGALFAGRTVSFDLKKRSEFFWLLNSEIPLEQVLVYIEQSHTRATDELARILADKKMGLVALTPAHVAAAGIPVWKYKLSVVDFLRLLAPSAARAWRQPKKLFYLAGLSYFILKYLYWNRFFRANNIKVNLNPTDFLEANIPMQQALADNGGVSISYHWSNIDFQSIATSNCSDIMFSFGPEYRETFRKNQSSIGRLVYCGYIADYAFSNVREDALKIREKLRAAGAEFIICFLDENSSDDKLSILTNKENAEAHAFFLRKVLEDPALGLILKPSYVRTIYERLGSISDLIEKAKKTGRCLIVDQGDFKTDSYPSEVAQAADLCVGHLFSGTVALESYLSGTPTVFLDLEKLYSNSIYQWGKGKVVFDNFEGLSAAIGRYRQNPATTPGFGDLSLWAKDRDFFKDGGASLRMGQYIGLLIGQFSGGKGRSEAVDFATKKYRERWGDDSVVDMGELASAPTKAAAGQGAY